jgi:hypothetical protein
MSLVWKPGFTQWDPASITTALWLDAADVSTITLNGSTVSQWNDKSGNNRHVSQATTGQQPTWNATGLNSKPILTFDGSNDVLLNASVGASGLSNVSIVSVFRQISGGASEDHQINIGQTGTTGKVRGFYREPSGTNLQFGGWASIATSTLSLDVGGTHHIFGFANSALSGAGNMLLMKDGSTQTLTTSAALDTTLDGFSVGSLQGAAISTYYSNISVAEIVVLYSTITTTDRQKLEGYLAHKWGLTANLPSDHPYKVNPPAP